MNFSEFFTTLSREEINSFSDEEVKKKRSSSLRNIIYILIPSFIVIELGIWYGYNTLWKVVLLLVVLLLIPKVISTSRLSQEFSKRKEANNEDE